MHKNRRQLLVAGPLILHDNARPHIVDVVTKKLRDYYGWEMLPHVPYRPDMSPPDFDIFPKLKEPMRGCRFSSLKELSIDVNRVIRHMNKSGVLDGRIMLCSINLLDGIHCRKCFFTQRFRSSIYSRLQVRVLSLERQFFY